MVGVPGTLGDVAGAGGCQEAAGPGGHWLKRGVQAGTGGSGDQLLSPAPPQLLSPAPRGTPAVLWGAPRVPMPAVTP